MVLTFEGKKLHQWMVAEMAKRLIEQGYEVRLRERIGNCIVDICAIDWKNGGQKYVYEVYVQPQRKVIEERYYKLKDYIDKFYVVIPEYEKFEPFLPIEVIKLEVPEELKQERKQSKAVKVPHDIYKKAVELKRETGLPIWKCIVLIAIEECEDIKSMIAERLGKSVLDSDKILEMLEDIRDVAYDIKDKLDNLIKSY